MSTASDQSEIADEVLRKIGRNVVNFQKMEGMLKVLVAGADFSGPIDEIKSIVEKKNKSTNKKPMGQLSNEFIKAIYSESDLEESPQESNKTRISFSFRVENGEKLIPELRKTHRFIVSERNRLIHKMLINFDASSTESCEQLISDLDVQAERLRPEYDNLRGLLKNFFEGRKELAKAMLSEEFRAKLENKDNDG
jgi:hypothetical protein